MRPPRTDDTGRIANISVTYDDHAINLLNIYAPNTDTERKPFFQSLSTYLSTTHYNIIGGDFNSIANSSLDKSGGATHARQTAVTTLHTLCSTHLLSDIWRDRNPTCKQFTWTGQHPITNALIRTRIDKFIISTSLSPYITKATIQPYPFSDHDMITLAIDFSQQPRGEGYWHFNNSLLADRDFQTSITDFWSSWLTQKHRFPDPLVWWDKAKHNFKKLAIQRSSALRKLSRHQRSQLENNLARFQRLATSGQPQDIQRYLDAKAQLREFETQDLEALTIRTHTRYHEEGEKSTRYFLSLEKAVQSKQTLNILSTDNLQTLTQPVDIIHETHRFYKDLYTADPITPADQDSFLDITLPRLSEHAQGCCEGLVSERELYSALSSMENNKSPGYDGLSTNFYKSFWHLLGHALTDVYNHAFLHGTLPLSQRRGIVTLLYKKGDRTKLKNWRPIPLLNTDYKILTKALSKRLTTVLPFIIHTDQTACIPGRTINDNTRLIQDTITYANESNTPLALISIDQLKAFDRVSHQFLFKTLSKFGLGPQFISWIQLLYNNVSSSIKTNGWLSAFIPLERGLRQGCALSMPLYILTAEILATHIRSHTAIHGLHPPGSATEVRISQYADDTTLFLTQDTSIHTVFEIFQNYERASGARINLDKCKGLWCGAFISRQDSPLDFEWNTDAFPDKILGLYIGNTDCSLRNLEHKIDKINTTIAAWRHRSLSFKGRALIINALLTSTLWYHATNLYFPSWAIDNIERAIYNFFWDNKRPLVSRDILSLPLTEGGFNIPRIATKIQALRINTIRRLLEPECAHWKSFTAYFLRLTNMPLGKLTLSLDYTPQHIDARLPLYHRDLLLAWHKHSPHHIRTEPPVILPDIMNEPLFRNPLITDHDTPLYYPEWARAGLIQVKDLCYIAIPGFLPPLAIHELLTTDASPTRSSTRTAREFQTILTALPTSWIALITTAQPLAHPSLQPVFCLSRPATNRTTHIPLSEGSTKVFYQQLRATCNIPIPALQHWNTNMPTLPPFNTAFWQHVYPSLASNKQGDVNWQLIHRVLPTALSLYRAHVYHTSLCHRCPHTDTIEHAILHCPSSHTFWLTLRPYLLTMTDNHLTLDESTKLFGLLPDQQRQLQLNNSTTKLVNWTLTIGRCAIHKAAVDYRLRSDVIPPMDLFKASVRSHLKYQYKLCNLRNQPEHFVNTWCIRSALASIANNKLVLHL